MHAFEAIITATLFLTLGAVIIFYLYWNHKNRLAVLETVQKSVEAGNNLTPDLLVKLGGTFTPRVRDMRRGIVVLFFGIAGFVASFFVGDSHAEMGLRVMSIFPTMVGAGFLIVWKLNRYDE